MNSELIVGFSRMSKEEKLAVLKSNTNLNSDDLNVIKQYWNPDTEVQNLHEEFTENCIGNYYLPYGLVPNFKINGDNFIIPVVTEESSVVAALSKSAKFWFDKNGFHSKVLGTKKVGHVHFKYSGNEDEISAFFNKVKSQLESKCRSHLSNMIKRGGGLLELNLINKKDELKDYYQIEAKFETCDSMGANIINTCLESIGIEFEDSFSKHQVENDLSDELEIIMCILSNRTFECLVESEIRCPVGLLNKSYSRFAEKFCQAVEIAEVNSDRAVTHNKGIMNGIDAVLIATGNDFRAVGASIHSYAARDGKYKSLSKAEISDGEFVFKLRIPLAIGVVGGITNLHRMSNLSLRILGNPSSRELMQIICSVGLAQNFAAVGSLVDGGIQKGHMRLHLINLINQLEIEDYKKKVLIQRFENKVVTLSLLKEELDKIN